jgi:hypothetical protein
VHREIKKSLRKINASKSWAELALRVGLERKSYSRTWPHLWSLFSDKPVYLDADPQSDCAILLLFSYPGDHMEARRLILRGAPLFPRSRRRSASPQLFALNADQPARPYFSSPSKLKPWSQP